MLNETHVTAECELNDLMINNYKFYKCNSHSKHTGGVCVYINKNIRHKNVKMLEQQIAWYISFEMNINNSPTVIACVYLSASESKSEILNSYDLWLDQLNDSRALIICGDYNIDMMTNSTYSRQLKNISDENGLQLLVDKPTRVEQNTATLIDLCFSNFDKRKIKCSVLNEDQISDHSMIEIKINGEN